MANITVAVAGQSDGPAIQQLHRALCLEERDAEYGDYNGEWIYSDRGSAYLSSRLRGDGLAVIARAALPGAEVVGYLLAGFLVVDGERAAALESMYVAKDFRRRGVGMALVQAFVCWFGSSDAQLASVAVAPANSAAATLYRKAGFADHAVIQDGRTLILTMQRSSGLSAASGQLAKSSVVDNKS